MAPRKMLWRPSAPPNAHNPFDKLTPRGSDWYLTVDEIEEVFIRLVVAPWPSVDSNGRLKFPTDFSEGELLEDPSDWVWLVQAQDFHRWLSEHRSKSSQDAPQRHLRVGDTFWFRGSFEAGAERRGKPSGKVLDVTYAAREEAKAAMAWAVTGSTMASPDLIVAGAALDEEETDTEPSEEVEAEMRPSIPGSVASPSI